MRVRPGWSLVLLLSPAFAAVDGTVIDGTTGKPAMSVSVALVQPGQGGMKTLAKTTSDASGKFSFTETPSGPGLVQASYQGVTYSKVMMPGAPTTGLRVDVYEATKKAVAKVQQHMVLIQPTGTELTVNETLLVQGDAKLTYYDPVNGTVRFYVPPEAKGVQVTLSAPGGMPIQRPAQKTKQPDVFTIDYPMKPGETRVDLAYTVAAANPAVFSGKVLEQGSKTRLVVPNGVSLKGDTISEIGKEPQSQATIYDVNGDSFRVEVQGVGSLRAAETAPDEDSGAPQIQQVPPHIYNKIYWITALAFAILGLGTYLLARR